LTAVDTVGMYHNPKMNLYLAGMTHHSKSHLICLR